MLASWGGFFFLWNSGYLALGGRKLKWDKNKTLYNIWFPGRKVELQVVITSRFKSHRVLGPRFSECLWGMAFGCREF